MKTVSLLPEEREQLIILARENKDVKIAIRIRALLVLDAGYTEKEVAGILLLDNARNYKNKDVTAYLARPGCQLELIFLPPYSPNLNFIERLWKFMKKYIIGVKYREKFKEFENDVMQFFENISQYKNELKTFIGTDMHLVKLTA